MLQSVKESEILHIAMLLLRDLCV